MSELKRANTWEISDSDTEHEPRTTAGPESAISRTQSAQGGGEPQPPTAVWSSNREQRVRQEEERERQKEDRVRQNDDKKRQKEERVRQRDNREGKKEERVRQKEERERQKEERERQKEERERQKEERERQRKEKREEQERKKETAERVRKLKPEEHLKNLSVNIHPVLLQDSGSDVVLGTLAALDWRSRIEEHELTHSISWSTTSSQTDDDDEVVEEDQVLMVVNHTEFIDLLMSIKQALIGGCEEEAESLFPPLCEFLNKNTGAVVTLLVIGGQYSQRGGSDDADYDDAVCPRSLLGLQNLDVEEVLVYLQLYKNVTVHFLFGWQEVTDHVCAVTKALSKRPLRSQQDAPDLGFCVGGPWAGGVRVERSGRGLAQVWMRQVQQLNRVSVAMATAVTAAYPSPRLLLQAYEKADSEEERCGLLADLAVRGGAKQRRIGPELSNRVHRLMTCSNPELVLD